MEFTSKLGQQLLSRNRAHELLDRSRRQHSEVHYPSVRLGCRRRLHPTQCLYGYSTSAVADSDQLQSCGLAVPRTDDSYPSTVKLLGRRAVPILPCPDWNNPLAESVPRQQIHGCVGSRFVVEHLELRKTPADRLVMLEKAAEQRELLLTQR